MPITGFIEIIEPFRLGGWAYDTDRPDAALNVEVLVNGVSVGTATANLYRPDLEQAAIGSGDHAFAFYFRKQVGHDDLSNISVKIQSEDGSFFSLPRFLASGAPKSNAAAVTSNKQESAIQKSEPAVITSNKKRFEVIYLHIGGEKTGTTSIQALLHGNRLKLAEFGVVYPASPGEFNHQKLSILVRSFDSIPDIALELGIVNEQSRIRYAESFRKEFDDELASSAGQTLILSDEHLSSRLQTEAEVTALFNCLNAYSSNIKVVIYLRPQDELLLSGYSTSIKAGSTDPLVFPVGADRDAMNYHVMLSRWSAVFDQSNIVARIFQQSRLIGSDAVVDFCSVVGIDSLQLSMPTRRNRSLDGKCILFLREFNRHIPRYTPLGVNSARGDVAELLAELYSGPRLSVNAKELAEFRCSFESSNQAVAKEFFPDRSGALFDDALDMARSEATELTAADAIQIAAALWNRRRDS